MLVLFETAAGFAIFKLLKEKKLRQSENLFQEFEDVTKAKKIVQLLQFKEFKDMAEALSSATALVEGKVSKSLKKVLKALSDDNRQEELAVADLKLGISIKNQFNIGCISNSAVIELMRCIRSQADSLIGMDRKLPDMNLGLAHSLSRYKLKFNPDKVDTMVVQAISLLDDIDKELNNFMMRAREWYGWHFPELSKIITDNVTFAKTVIKLGFRTNAQSCDLSDFLTEEVEAEVKEAAEISMGTEIGPEDLENITVLCSEIVKLADYRKELHDYLIGRMNAVAPNLSALVGEVVGARLLSHAGTLLSLAKQAASTVQILGAEKALFRALKARHDTPKYGLIYHAQMVGQSTPKNKGKISRMLAAKAALAVRIDAFSEGNENNHMGMEQRIYLERRLRELDNRSGYRISGSGKRKAQSERYESKSSVYQYNTAADSTLPSVLKTSSDQGEVAPTPIVEKQDSVEASSVGSSLKKKKKKKDKKQLVDDMDTSRTSTDASLERKPKRKHDGDDGSFSVEDDAVRLKKVKKEVGKGAAVATVDLSSPSAVASDHSHKKKKKKKKASVDDL